MPGSDRAGRGVVAASWAGTAVFAVVAGANWSGVEALDLLAVVVPVGLFVASLPVALYALARAAVRTARRGERITVSGLFFLRGSAPAPVRRQLLGSLFVTVVVTVATAWVVPFGVLASVYPLALCGLWAARHGTFPPIPEPAPPQARAPRPGSPPPEAGPAEGGPTPPERRASSGDGPAG